jgi:hypothetical protein
MANVLHRTTEALGNTIQNAAEAAAAATGAVKDVTKASGQAASAVLNATTTGIDAAKTGMQVASDVANASGKTVVTAIDTGTTGVKTLNNLLTNTNQATSHIYDTLNGSLKGIAPAGENVTRMASTTIGDATKYASSLTKAITNALSFPLEKYNKHVEKMNEKENTPEYIFKNIKLRFFNEFNENVQKILKTSTEQLDNLIQSFDDLVRLYKENSCNISESTNWFGKVTKNEDCSNVKDIITKLAFLKNYITRQKENVIKLMQNKFLEISSIRYTINATTQDDITIKMNELNQIQTKIINEASEILEKTIEKINTSVNYIQTQIDETVEHILGTDKESNVQNEVKGGRKRRKSKRSKRSKKSTKKTTKKSKRTRKQ